VPTKRLRNPWRLAAANQLKAGAHLPTAMSVPSVSDPLAAQASAPWPAWPPPDPRFPCADPRSTDRWHLCPQLRVVAKCGCCRSAGPPDRPRRGRPQQSLRSPAWARVPRDGPSASQPQRIATMGPIGEGRAQKSPTTRSPTARDLPGDALQAAAGIGPIHPPPRSPRR